MSSRFNQPRKTRRPPYVCHKTAAGKCLAVYPLDETPLRGSLSYKSPTHGVFETISTPILATPGPATWNWIAFQDTGWVKFALLVTYSPTTGLVDAELDVYLGPTKVDTLFFAPRPRESALPFDSGVMYPLPPAIKDSATLRLIT